MDRYYDNQTVSLPAKDLQLTAVTALFVASKNLEVDPLDLRTCIKTLCFNKYSKSQFLEKESGIREATQYENEAPSSLDFIMILIRLLKCRLQTQIDCLESTVDFLLEVQTIAYDICKSCIIDCQMLRYKPSIVAMALIFLGFQLQFELLQ